MKERLAFFWESHEVGNRTAQNDQQLILLKLVGASEVEVIHRLDVVETPGLHPSFDLLVKGLVGDDTNTQLSVEGSSDSLMR